MTPGTLARASADRPWRAVAAWGVAVLAAIACVVTLMQLESEQRLTNDPESYRGAALVAERLDQREEIHDIVIVRSETHTVDDREFRAFVESVFASGAKIDGVAGAQTYLTSDDAELVSRDRHATMIPITLGPAAEEAIEDLIALVQRADRDRDFSVDIVGEFTIDRDFLQLSQKDLKEGEIFFGAPVSLVVLLFVFGAVVAGLLPLMLAVVSIVVALGLVALVSQAFELSIFVINMLTAVGLALGIDYALFVVSRYREERAHGRPKEAAIAAAGATASRAVFFSGSAFVIALVGMLLVPDTIMRSLAAGAILVGIVSVVAALTLLPAVLSLLGDRINALRIPFVSKNVTTGEREARFWTRAVGAVMRRPVLSLVLSVALLLLAALPVLDLKTGFASVSSFPESTVSRQGLEALERDFRGGHASPVQIVVSGDVNSPDVKLATDKLLERIEADDRFGPTSTDSNGTDVLRVSSPLPGGSTDATPVAAVRDLRGDYIPRFFEGVEADVLVAGTTAENVDYFDTMDYWLPIVFAFVLGLSFVLLTIVFRSVVVAFKAILLNLLSVGAAYGLLVLVFEKGYGADLLGLTQVDTVVAWVPLFLFCVLFGLSMDYHVFLLSRIRERYEQTGDNDDAVAHGIRSTARLITGAALIIIVVFVGFATGDLVMFQQMGFGVAVALLLDATIVRTVLVPAAMKLLDRANWYLPRWLEWLPRVAVDEPAPAASTPRAAPAGESD